MIEITIKTVLLEALYMHLMTWAPATRDEYRILRETRERIEKQTEVAREATSCELGKRGAFGFPPGKPEGAYTPVTLRLADDQIAALNAQSDRKWPYNVLDDDAWIDTLNKMLDTDLPAWKKQAEAKENVARMTPSERKELAKELADAEKLPDAPPPMPSLGVDDDGA